MARTIDELRAEIDELREIVAEFLADERHVDADMVCLYCGIPSGYHDGDQNCLRVRARRLLKGGG